MPTINDAAMAQIEEIYSNPRMTANGRLHMLLKEILVITSCPIPMRDQLEWIARLAKAADPRCIYERGKLIERSDT